jgi:hypothetical protein
MRRASDRCSACARLSEDHAALSTFGTGLSGMAWTAIALMAICHTAVEAEGGQWLGLATVRAVLPAGPQTPGEPGTDAGVSARVSSKGWRVLRRLRDGRTRGRPTPWSRGLGRQPGVREGCEDKQLAADDRATLYLLRVAPTSYP